MRFAYCSSPAARSRWPAARGSSSRWSRAARSIRASRWCACRCAACGAAASRRSSPWARSPPSESQPLRSARPHAASRALEAMPRERLAALQLERLRATLRNAYEHVPWQRAAAAGRRAADRRSERRARARRCAAPALHGARPICAITTRSACSRGRVEQLARMHASSGTTGKPTVVGYTQADLDTWADLMARSLHCAGVRRGDVVHNAYGYGLFTGGLGAHAGAERLGAVVVPVSGGAHRTPGGADHGLRRARAVRDAVVRTGDRRSGRAAGRGPAARARCAWACSAPSRGARRCAARSSRVWACWRSTSTACRRSWARAWPANANAAGRPARLGGSLPVRGDRSRHAAGRCPRARPANW